MTSKKIVIIDDDPDIRLSLEQILNSKGYDAISFEDGFDFFKYLKNGDIPNLILLDVMMPVMSGWEIQRKLEKNPKWKKIPIIFITCRTTDTAKEMANRYGIDYIEKPFDIEDLTKRVKIAIKG